MTPSLSYISGSHQPPSATYRRRKTFSASLPAETKKFSYHPIYSIHYTTRHHAPPPPSSPSTAGTTTLNHHHHLVSRTTTTLITTTPSPPSPPLSPPHQRHPHQPPLRVRLVVRSTIRGAFGWLFYSHMGCLVEQINLKGKDYAKIVKNQSKPGNMGHKIESLHQKSDQRAFFYNKQANEAKCEKIESSSYYPAPQPYTIIPLPHPRSPHAFSPNPSCLNGEISLDGVYKAGSSRSTGPRINYAKSFGKKTQGMLLDCQGGNPCAIPPYDQRLGSNQRGGSRISIYYK
uniref:Uncharacterized protein n=1 Tax=Tanacetum cinerariifolium TaxID=118510 RepID=A0A6L2MIF4_TANCI|nr:hypothetical protein [Tanacetum cinerariifolium]